MVVVCGKKMKMTKRKLLKVFAKRASKLLAEAIKRGLTRRRMRGSSKGEKELGKLKKRGESLLNLDCS